MLRGEDLLGQEMIGVLDRRIGTGEVVGIWVEEGGSKVKGMIGRGLLGRRVFRLDLLVVDMQGREVRAYRETAGDTTMATATGIN